MEVMYLNQEKVVLKRRSEHIEVFQRGRKMSSFPLVHLKCIVVMNTCQITAPALELLFEKGIHIIYATHYGKIIGQLLSQKSGGVILRLAQYKAFQDRTRRTQIAAEIVRAKIRNQASVLRENLKRYPERANERSCNEILAYSEKIKEHMDIDAIMGYEGISARLYWQQFQQLLGETSFSGREYRPTRDPINALLNLGYSFLANGISLCLTAEGLDLEIGFLHSILYGRNSLVLDFMPHLSMFLC